MKKLYLFLYLGILSYNLKAQCVQANFASTAPACSSTLVNFTNTSGNSGAGWTYSWDFDYNGGGNVTPQTSTSQNPVGIDYSPGGNGVYTVAFTVKNIGLGCSSTILIDVDIRTARANFITSSNSICVGDSVNYFNSGTLDSSPSATVSHSWSFGAGATPSISNAVSPPPVTYSTSGAKTITHTVTVNYGGCGGTRTDLFTQTISVNPQPTPSFTSSAPVCDLQSVNYTYTGSIGIDYAWDFGTGATPLTSTAQNPSGIAYSGAGTKVVTLMATNAFGCSKTITQNITIKVSPVASFTSTAPECTGLSVNFLNTGTSSGVSYAWDFGADVIPSTSSTQNPSGVVYSTAGTKVITMIITDSTSGCAVTVTQTININQTPTAGFSSNAPQCVRSMVNFTNAGSTGGSWSYLWDFGQNAVPQTSSSENPSGINYSTGGTKTVTVSVSNGYCIKTSTQTISINSLPIANAGLDTTICANTSVQIGSSAVSGNTYNWFPTSTLNNSTISNPVSSPIAPVTQYVVTVSNTATGCISTDTTNVTMLSPLIANSGVDGIICRYDSVQLGIGLIEGQMYSWSPSNGLSSTILPNPVASPSTTTTYTITVIGSGCAAEKDEVTIIVHQLPLINAGIDDTITVGSSTELIVTGGEQYTWSPSYGLSNIGIYNPIANPDSTTLYAVIGIDIYGCINKDTVMVKVLKPFFWVPTAFTPDGNGENDMFFVRGEGIENFEFGIFNRWGEQIFYSKNQAQGWDGKLQISGDDLPGGAYVYYVKGVLTSGDPIDAKGMINLIR